MTVPWFLGFPDITAWHIFILKYLFIWHSPSSAFSLDVLSLVPLLQPSMLSVDELFNLGDTLPQSLSLQAPSLGCTCSQQQCEDSVEPLLSLFLPSPYPSLTQHSITLPLPPPPLSLHFIYFLL